jgi:chromate transporter
VQHLPWMNRLPPPARTPFGSYRAALTRPLVPFFRASVGHLGAAAATASLRRDLVERQSFDAAAFDQAFAIARLTPGTNLLALYTLLGHALGGWRLAVSALAVGTIAPALVTLLMAAAYTAASGNPLVARGMQGARAGALAVFLWAVVQLARPQLAAHGRRGAVLALAALAAVVVFPSYQLLILIAAGGLGASVLGDRR